MGEFIVSTYSIYSAKSPFRKGELTVIIQNITNNITEKVFDNLKYTKIILML